MDSTTFELLTADFYGFESRLTPAEKELLVGVRAFLEEQVRPIADEYWERAEFPRQLIPGIHATGVIGLSWPETRTIENSSVFRGWVALEFGRVDASIATYVGVQNGLVMGTVGVAGSEEQRAEWLPKLASGEVIGAFGLTEPHSGSDSAQGLRTTARREGDTWILDGEKRWIGNATFSDVTVIWAKDVADGQVKGFLVPTSTPGYRATAIARKQSLRTVQNADIVLEGVRVPESLRLQGANSFRDTAKVLRLTRAEVAWQAIGVAIGAYDAALRYARERVQFGKPLVGHQLVQDLLVKSIGNITASIALATRVSEMLDAGEQRDEHSALAKAYTTARMRETVAWCREVMGGNGIVLDYGVARFFADAEALYSYEGTREMNTLIVGRAITGSAAFV
ncbi:MULTISPECIES: acyl-CoA dehydrogenase family protein [Rathayibacter]|uniref:Acyl-CoA dehydrogenase n=1 Tax=Rathayibacter festucae DSM 15932 TaxID=1328866 RepID=A0A3T0SXC2_9MICO|nr:MULTISPECIES: acyl-CoA dehydrogenase family protein [Rathayibacter]AZZ51021.1 acyl-CoA dehydrogenase [Rathayibacter festucae DSM 15932]MCJ1704807.1 acyl-CoA dehydrogenase family protein [Rathayibacter sp. VKM Ac-2926]TCL84577.1 glutaryl-CoA dehydrogenase [Rathayibacter sp. PhB192]TCM30295.1 glutaryl-CoA dehydrogenase [Rathayibacter sp. PhB179]TDX75527.1 glutaryl-CoA dehydrogenase [Rathayibacter sp. PhB151]